jgi:hypothetical protein
VLQSLHPGGADISPMGIITLNSPRLCGKEVAAKKYQTVQITNVYLHDSGAGMVDAYLTVQGELLFITDCGDAQRVTVPKAWFREQKFRLATKRIVST